MKFQSHGEAPETSGTRGTRSRAAPPAGNDVAVDERADFGYLLPPCDGEGNYLREHETTLDELDQLGNLMIDAARFNDIDASPDSSLPPVLTYWGQFLDHELTARTDREGDITSVEDPTPVHSAATIEANLKNARTPAFDLDSVYGGRAVGPNLPSDVSTLISGLRDPAIPAKMRLGTAEDQGPLPDGKPAVPDNLDSDRDLPRYGAVESEVREAALNMARAKMSPEAFSKFESTLDKRAMIGDMRNDENLVVAQFHLSVLRFHNCVVDFLDGNDTGWIADFHAAQTLTRLHYQWLAIEGYLKSVCRPDVVQRVVDDRASAFFRFRAEHLERNPDSRKGNALPLEFSVAAYRFGHSMVRNIYDYNRNFGRGAALLPNAPFNFLFAFTGDGGFQGASKLPENWIIDWRRFVGVEPVDSSDGQPARSARKVDTELAPPLGRMINQGGDHPDGSDVQAMFKHLARRNLRRGYNLRLPTGQALHRHLRDRGELQSDPIDDVGALFDTKPDMQDFLRNSRTDLGARTPLWFYCLAEAEAGGGETLGELGSWLVASTFTGVMLSDPTSALSTGFEPLHSPLRMSDGSPIDSIAKWMEFAKVMESGDSGQKESAQSTTAPAVDVPEDVTV